MQKGRVYQKGPSWFLRYRLPAVESGEKQWKDVVVRLAPFDGRFKSKKSVQHLAQQVLAPINNATVTSDSTQRVRDFIEYVYFPNVEKRPSTINGYRHIFEKHLRNRLGDVRILDFRTVTGQKLMQKIADDTGLSRTSLKHIKHFLTGVFTFAKQQGAFDGENPMRDVGIPKGDPPNETHAYSLEQILAMLEILPEPAKTVVATAALTGLRRSELRGLRWEDLAGNELRVNRTVWNTVIEDKTKTKASKAPVPLVPTLQRKLEAHRNGAPADGFIFAGEKMKRPLNLANLARRVIVPKLRAAGVEWRGWHAFRRGLGTNLYGLGVPDKDIQAILRHANVNTTLTYYVKTAPANSQVAMQKLERAFNLGIKSGIRRKKQKSLLTA